MTTGPAWVSGCRRGGSPVGRAGTAIAARDRQTPPGPGMPLSGRRCGARRRARRSGGGAQVLSEHLSGCLPREGLARPTVQRRRDGRELLGTVAGEVGASGEILAQQPVGVLVGGALPGAAWITEIDLQTAVEPKLDVLGHLDPLVPGQRPPKLFREGRDRL